MPEPARGHDRNFATVFEGRSAGGRVTAPGVGSVAVVADGHDPVRAVREGRSRSFAAGAGIREAPRGDSQIQIGERVRKAARGIVGEP